MKKFIFLFVGILSFFLFAGGIAYFAPNELAFKIANTEGNFLKAEKTFPQWKLMAENNALGKLYDAKKYTELQKKLASISQKKCSLKNKKISEYCANIFYLQGLTQYQFGKNKKSTQQKKFFEHAIMAFTKVMAMTSKQSQEYVWSKENIAFLQKKFAETQKKEQKKQRTTQQKSTQNKESIDQKSSSSSKKQGNSGKNTEQKKKDEEKKKTSSDTSAGKSGKTGKTKETNTKNSQNAVSQKSRLPQKIQKELEERQKALEENQKRSQRGFNRSQSAAKKSMQNYDPFDDMRNDPFFQQFFGNDPFFQRSFGQKKFYNKNIQNQNEKDW